MPIREVDMKIWIGVFIVMLSGVAGWMKLEMSDIKQQIRMTNKVFPRAVKPLRSMFSGRRPPIR